VRADHFSPDVQALVETFASHGVRFLLVGGEAVVRGGVLVHADEQEIAREHRKQAARLPR